MKRILPPTLFFICVIIMIVILFLFPNFEFLNFPFNLIGLLVLIFGLWLAKYSSDIFEEERTNIYTFNDPTFLVTHNIYKLTRNPMYLGFLVSLIGITILIGNILNFIIVFVFFIITDRWYIRFEEKIMEKTFGKNYEEYKQTTKRWL